MNSLKSTCMFVTAIAVLNGCFFALAEHESSESAMHALSKQGERALARAMAAESEGRWGAALLWSTYGSMQHPELNDWRKYIDEARAAIIDRWGVYLAVSFEKGHRDGADREFDDALLASLQAGLPASIRLVDGIDAAGKSVYQVSPGKDAFSVLQYVDRTEDRIHTYTEQVRVANPR